MEDEDPLLVELGKLRTKMHSRVFDEEEDIIDLNKVMNDVYENFSRICKVISTRFEHTFFQSFSRSLTFEVRLFDTFFRCVLKCCVGVDGIIIINKNLVLLLTDMELHFFHLAKSLLKCIMLQVDGIWWTAEYHTVENYVRKTEHFTPRAENAYLLEVLNAGCSPSHSMISEEFVVDFLDQVLVDLSYCRRSNQIKTLSDGLRFLRNYLQLSKDWITCEKFQELLILVEAVVDKMACYSFLNYHHNKLGELFLKIESSIEAEMDTAILNVLLFLDSDPPLTDQLLMGFVDCLRKNLITLLKYDAIDLQCLVKDQLQLLQELLRFLVHLLLNILRESSAQEKVLDLQMKFQVLARDIGYVIILFLNNDTKGNTAANMGFGPPDFQ